MDSKNFTEKAFYLAEFQGRTLAISCAAATAAEAGAIGRVLDELQANRTKLVLLAGSAELADELKAPAVSAPAGAGSVWRSLAEMPRVSVQVPAGEGFARACRRFVAGWGISKWVYLDAPGALTRPDGKRVSFVDLAELAGWLEHPEADVAKRAGLLREIETALREGIPAINVCPADGLGDELFSYAGSGTLFTRERYVEVRRLGVDDFAAAADLVGRGVSEGYLLPRSDVELDRIFENGFGAFVEGRYLAGFGALMPHAASNTGEIASLYTLTRFIGEGIGRHLVAALCRASADRREDFVFACTTQEAVASFFERQRFRRVALEDLPTEKWQAYEAARRERLICLRLDPAQSMLPMGVG